MKYDVVIGLEIHAELNTNTKLFCSCKNDTSSDANANVCPICLAWQDAPLGKTNRAAVEKTILAGLSVDCAINDLAVFERKHYFYPDLPAGFQTSQLERPICLAGSIRLKSGKVIRINRIHLEEDAGKLIHDDVAGETLVDLNRAGTPLIEMVTEPDISSAAEAVEFLETVRSRYVFAGIANCRMEEGGLRCDVNISLKPIGSKTLGKRVELKNINSFKMVVRAIEFETRRQADILDAGGSVKQETRRWNDASGKSTAMRSKETATDYRYFPDPDKPSIVITREEVEALKKSLPTLAHQYKDQFITEYKLPQYDADVLTKEFYICDFFVKSVALLNEPKKISNWLMTNILAKDTGNIKITPKQFVDVIRLTDSRKITRQNALVLIDSLWGNPLNVESEKMAKDLKIYGGISREEIQTIITELFAENPNAITDYALTPDKVINFFMGQTMKRTGGMADSIITKEIILSKLK